MRMQFFFSETSCQLFAVSCQLIKLIMIERLISLSLRNRFLVLLLPQDYLPGESIPLGSIKLMRFLTLGKPGDRFYRMDGTKPADHRRSGNLSVGNQSAGTSQGKICRGSSMFGMSFVYVIFDDDTDVYWARERVLERLNYASQITA